MKVYSKYHDMFGTTDGKLHRFAGNEYYVVNLPTGAAQHVDARFVEFLDKDNNDAQG